MTAIVRRMAQQAHELRDQLGDNPHADSIAQAAACAAPILASEQNWCEALDWLRPQLEPWEQPALHQAQVGWAVPTTASIALSVGTAHLTAHLYDTFLHHYSRSNRKRGGVFFTPEPIADYIVAQIDRL